MDKEGLNYDRAVNYLTCGLGEVVYYESPKDPLKIYLVKGKPVDKRTGAEWECDCGCKSRRNTSWAIR